MDVEESVTDKEKIHEDIARIKAALQSDGGEASAEESDDQELEQAACPELAGEFYGYGHPARFILLRKLSLLECRHFFLCIYLYIFLGT